MNEFLHNVAQEWRKNRYHTCIAYNSRFNSCIEKYLKNLIDSKSFHSASMHRLFIFKNCNRMFAQIITIAHRRNVTYFFIYAYVSIKTGRIHFTEILISKRDICQWTQIDISNFRSHFIKMMILSLTTFIFWSLHITIISGKKFRDAWQTYFIVTNSIKIIKSFQTVFTKVLRPYTIQTQLKFQSFVTWKKM